MGSIKKFTDEMRDIDISKLTIQSDPNREEQVKKPELF